MKIYAVITLLLVGCENSDKYTVDINSSYPIQSHESYISFLRYPEDSLKVLCNCRYDSLERLVEIDISKYLPSKSYLNNNRKFFYKWYPFNRPINILNQFSRLKITIDEQKVKSFIVEKGSQEHLIDDEYIIEKKVTNYQLTLNQNSILNSQNLAGMITAKLPTNFGWKKGDNEIYVGFKCGKGLKKYKKKPKYKKGKEFKSHVGVLNQNAPEWIDSKFNSVLYNNNNRFNSLIHEDKYSTLFLSLNEGFGHGSGFGIFFEMKSFDNVNVYFQYANHMPEDTSDVHMYAIENKQLFFNKNPFDAEIGDTIVGKFHVVSNPKLLLFGDTIEAMGQFTLRVDSIDHDGLIDYLREKRHTN